MTSLDWSNEDDIFKRKIDLNEMNNTFTIIKDKWSTTFNPELLSKIIAIEIDQNSDKNSNYVFTVENIQKKIKRLYIEFLTWTLSILISSTQRYLKRPYSVEIRKSLSWLFNYLLSFSSSSHTIELLNTQIIIVIIFFIQFISSFGADYEKLIHSITIGRFLNINIDYLFQKPNVYWFQGDRKKAIESIENKTKHSYLLVGSNDDFKKYNNKTTVVFDLNTYSKDVLLEIIQGKKLIVSNLSENSIIIFESIYVLSENEPENLHDYNVKEENIYFFHYEI